MARRFLILFLLLCYLQMSSFSQAGDKDERLRQIIREYSQVKVKVPLSNLRSLNALSQKVSILSVKEKIVYISLSPLTSEWFLLQNLDYQILESTDFKGITTASSVSQAMEWDSYPSYLQYDSIMQSFLNLYPSLCQLDTIGTSINGKLILALKISDNASNDEEEPEVFYTSTIHGDETGGFVLMLRLADYLLKNYSLDSRVKNLVDNLQIWINPLANPDGTYFNGSTVSSSSVRYNANGYDLNRNFPDPVTPNTIKQKETLDMISFMRKHKFVISANFHSGEEVVNYPWDRWISVLHADNSWFNTISRAYADTVHIYSGTGYMNFQDNGVTRGAVWYSINGGRQDFVTSGLQGREVTIELDDQFITPAAQLSLLWMYNWRSLLGYIENALYGIHGVVLNSETSLPVAAKVFIVAHDKDSSQVYSDPQTGNFIRLLASGSWNLTFSSPGYYTQVISNIIVTPGQKIDLVVNLVPVTNSIDTTNPENPVLYPNPATSSMWAVLPQRIAGPVNVRIISMSGRIISDYDIVVLQGSPVPIEVSKFLAGVYSVVFTNSETKSSCRSRFIVIK